MMAAGNFRLLQNSKTSSSARVKQSVLLGNVLTKQLLTGALACSLLVLSAFPSRAAATSVGGFVAELSWTTNDSPVTVTNDLVVSNLTVRAGVVVQTMPGFQITVTNILAATGSSTNLITFGATDINAGWLGLRLTSTNAGCTFQGCVVQNATSGGLRIQGAPLTIRQSNFLNNRGRRGGAISSDSTLTLESCSLQANAAYYTEFQSPFSVDGGGIYYTGTNLTLNSCTLTNNTAIMPYLGNVIANSTGGGISLQTGTLTLNRCIFAGNQVRCDGLTPRSYGGAVYGAGSGLIIADNCTFTGNSSYCPADGGGGAIAAFKPAVFRDCTFDGNGASTTAGHAVGTALWSTDSLNATNCIFTRNSGSFTFNGGTVSGAWYGGSGVAENCTVVYNSVAGFDNFSGTIRNSIIYFNSPQQIYGSPTLLYSDVQGGYAGTGQNIITTDPGFLSSTDFRLTNNASAVDMGDPAAIFNDVALPPSLGTIRNDLGAYGGPGAALWSQFVPTTLQLSLYPGVTIQGLVGGTYAVQVAPNLTAPIAWQTLTNIVLPYSPFLFFDSVPAIPGQQRYYRAVITP